MTDVLIKHRERLIEAAKRYAAADKSDPFTFARAMCHINNKIAGFTPKGENAFYDATTSTEERHLPDNTAYIATVYRSMVRP